jgi:hypothetical protein
MDFDVSLKETSKQIISIALEKGEDVSPLCDEYGVFESSKRWIEFWVKDDSLCYHLSGEISTPPAQIAESRPSFQGIWDEAGTIPNLEQAFELLRAWLLEGKEIDELPDRSIRRWLI